MTDTTTAGDLPRLATCSYREYRRDMGTAVRITLGAPRWITLPDPRYSAYAKWPYLTELAPHRSYFKAPRHIYEPRYILQLNRFAADIERKLTWIPAEHGRLTLLCYETHLETTDTWCHRRLFASWAEQRWGIEVPELGAP